ncbi:probable PTR2 - Di- and tripeptide permease [Ustilago trichophora]|uniref:Probable PTR2 - Di- and tripeptide permease n=1 Tax=Ustilago trichophora TaxID=86804 RepID=A0A5C3ELS7_9BASI|nr:probable PTR2 - Di- and tripeptide permease [Ustilago trichophora]
MPADIQDNAVAGHAEAQKDLYDADVKIHGGKNDVHPIGHLEHGVSANAQVTDDDFVAPTEEELSSLRRVPEKLPWTTYAIAFCELAERFSYYGCVQVFQNFIQQPRPVGSRTGAGGANNQSGALGEGQQAATGLTTFNTFWVYCMPILGAYLADTRWGRFKTICIAVFVAMLGHILLIVSSLPTVLDNQSGAMACFVISIIISGVGTGFFKSSISPLIAEQVNGSKQSVQTLKTGERVIVDPVLTVSRIFMYFYLFINIGALGGQLGMSFAEKYVGFWLSYTLPTIVFALCIPVLVFGNKYYVKTPPSGSVLAECMRLWKFATKGRWSLDPVALVKNMRSDDFWENAKPSKQSPESRPKWMTFDDAWVDEVRRGFKACTVFLWFPLYWLTYNQITNNLVSQAATMEVNGLPNEVVSNLDPFALVILIPVFDLFLYPALRKAGFNFTPLKKIALGFLTGALAMVWAAVVQHYIYKTSQCGKNASSCYDINGDGKADLGADGSEAGAVFVPAPLNVWIQSGSYILIAISEILASITGLEYAFSKAPKSMRSLVMSIFLFTSAIAAALQQAFIALSGDPNLVWSYTVFGCLAFAGFIGFSISFRKLDAEEDALNQLDAGKLREAETSQEGHDSEKALAP